MGTTQTTFLDGRVALHCGDSRDVLRELDSNSIDSVVCDPPYALVSIQKRFGKPGSAAVKVPADGTGAYARASAGFMGQQWDTGETAFAAEFWAEVLRVLKPGGYVVAFSGTRTYHRMACAIEDAGFEIRDQLGYLFGSGFPKSHNVSRKLDDIRCACSRRETPKSVLQHDVRSVPDPDVSEAGAVGPERREILQPGLSEQGTSAEGRKQFSTSKVRGRQPSVEGWSDATEAARELCVGEIRPLPTGSNRDGSQGRVRDGAPPCDGEVGGSTADAIRMRAPHRPQAVEQPAQQLGIVAGQPQSQDGGAWSNCGGCGKPIIPDGIGTALKPAWEPICLARKPLIGTVAENVLEHGTGALNIDGCRIVPEDGDEPAKWAKPRGGIWSTDSEASAELVASDKGRWPANIIHDGSDEVLAAFPETDPSKAANRGVTGRHDPGQGADHNRMKEYSASVRGVDDNGGSAARFFYTAKADADDRLGSKHPTVKPLDLMQYLVRLVTPPGGTVLDPFAGTGTTGEAAWREGFRAVLIEREPEYQADISRRMDLAAKPMKRAAVAKTKNNLQGAEGTPLFGDSAA